MDSTYLQQFLSDSAKVATRNEIRELLKLIARPEVISLAGGLPSPTTFPTELLADILPDVLRDHGNAALQYGPTEGDLGLRRAVGRPAQIDRAARRTDGGSHLGDLRQPAGTRPLQPYVPRAG